MRFHPAKGLATAGAIAAILAATACSTSSSSSSSIPVPSVPAPSASSAAASPSAASSGAGSAGSSGSTSSGAEAQIKKNWEDFFSSSTPNSKRVTLLQNGTAFSSAIDSLSTSPLAAGLSATVTSVTVTSATQATVKYNLVAGGQTVQSGATGTAVLENGVWKVGDASFCGLLTEAGSLLNIKVPAACSSAH